jgi:hypothetical protein
MQKNSQINWLVTLAAVGIVGCSGADSGTPQDSIALGKVDLPLSTTASNGTKYALAGRVDLAGPQSLTATMSPTDPAFVDQPLFFTTTAGSYTLTLSNWALYDVGAGMPPSLSPTSGAILVSPATQPIDIVANQTTQAGYRFAVPGGVATFGNGSLNVDISVDVGYPDGTACTQNSDCASNACVNGVCGAAATCTDGVQNGGETGVDCGGTCPPCAGACDPTLPTSCPMGQSCVVDPTTGLGSCQASSTGGPGCLKINEVSTGSPASASDEYVELYNACATAVDVSGARLLYRAAAGVNDVVLTTASPGSIFPAGGFLVFGGTAFTGPSNGLLAGGIAAAGGGIAIVDANGVKLDSVGYGTATNIYVETTAAVAPSSGNSIGRRPDGSDTDDNSVDFVDQPRSPGAPNL